MISFPPPRKKQKKQQKKKIVFVFVNANQASLYLLDTLHSLVMWVPLEKQKQWTANKNVAHPDLLVAPSALTTVANDKVL